MLTGLPGQARQNMSSLVMLALPGMRPSASLLSIVSGLNATLPWHCFELTCTTPLLLLQVCRGFTYSAVTPSLPTFRAALRQQHQARGEVCCRPALHSMLAALPCSYPHSGWTHVVCPLPLVCPQFYALAVTLLVAIAAHLC